MAEISVFKREMGRRDDEGAFQVAVTLDSYGEVDNEKLLTPLCVSGLEWDQEIDRIIRRLEAIRSQGKEFLRA